jgi:perosamine synthetase
MSIELNIPNISSVEKKIVNEALSKNEISTYGSNIPRLEERLKKYTGSRYNLAVSSGSSGLSLAYLSSGILKNDLIIIPSYTFAATANSVYHAGGLPWFFDIDKDTFCLNIEQLNQVLKKTTFLKNKQCFLKKNKQRIFAITPVFTFGLLPNLKNLKKVAKKYNLKIIADAACALGSKFEDKNHTDYSDVSVFSLNGNKSFTAGGGGIISTNNKKFFLKAKSLATNCKIKNYTYSGIGFNLRITNLHASIALAQMNRFIEISNKKKKITKTYEKRLKKCRFLPKNSWCKNILWFNVIILKNKSKLSKTLKFINKKKIKCGIFWKPLHLQNPYKKFKKEKLDYTNEIWNKILVLPSSSNLKIYELNRVIKIVNLIN